MSYAAVVTRDLTVASDAVRDALVVAGGRSARGMEPMDRVPWLLALTRTECLRQLRARTVFGDTPGTVSLADGDPFDALTPIERDALALAVRDDIDRDQSARAMGCSVGVARSRVESAQRAWTDVARTLLLLRDPPDCARLPHLAEECVDDDGTIARSGWRRLAGHARSCAVCMPVVRPQVVEALSEMALPAGMPAPGVTERAAELAARSDRVEHLIERAGPWRADGFPVPPEDDPDARVWARRAAVLTAISGALLLVALIVLGLTSR